MNFIKFYASPDWIAEKLFISRTSALRYQREKTLKYEDIKVLADAAGCSDWSEIVDAVERIYKLRKRGKRKFYDQL